jgi:hypothetical protein
LLIIVSITHLGYYCVYRYQQQQQRKEMEAKLFENISESELDIIVLEENRDYIEWEKEGEEFVLQGEMYDVAKIKKVKGKTLLYCINDKKERQLLNDYSKVLKSTTCPGKSGKHIASFQLPDFLYALVEKNTGFTLLPNKKLFDFNTALTSSEKEINVPPPKA